MNFLILFRRAAGAALAALMMTLPAAAQQASKPEAPQAARIPTPQELARVSPSGSYLAARQAGKQRDAAAASAYYRAALKADPKNPELVERAFLSVLTEGDVEEAVRLAERLLQADKNNRMARLVAGVRAIKQKQYPVARQHLAQSIRGPITDLAATLLSAWTYSGTTETKTAIDAIDHLAGPDWYAIFKDLHAGLILDLAGKKEAGKRLEKVQKLDPSALRVVQAYASWAARNGAKDEATKVLDAFDKLLPAHPFIVEAKDQLKRGERIPQIADGPQTGAAEVLYGLGASLGRRGGEDLSIVYLQLALYLAPTHSLALLSLADIYEAVKKPDDAIKVYERVPPNSPLRRNAQIQLAINLDTLDRTDDAKKHLDKLIAENPKDHDAIMALGTILRGRKQFRECGDVYTKAINTIGNPDKSKWLIYYFRGICYERSKQWAKAETDLKKALELSPEQPHVLNYLGYSWIDQGVNLDDGMAMIRKAVEQRPDDGYIVDSLGWAHYRIGNFEEAVKHLERAVELRPEDPTINDHLGDAYAKVGRELEARFQWSHARDLKPEPEDLPKIEEKLRTGLVDEVAPSAAVEKSKKGANGG